MASNIDFGAKLTMDDKAQAFLHADNIHAWLGTGLPRDHLMQWLQKNIRHATNNCPNVVAAWDNPNKEHYLRQSSWEVLRSFDDEEKLAFLEDRPQDAFEAQLHGWLKKEPRYWKSLSPAWIGPVGSPLRQAAVAMGWETKWLPGQVVLGLFEPTAAQWTKWVPFPHSITMVSNLSKASYWRIRGNTSTPWADPRDVCLAQELSRVFDGGEPFTFVPHKNVPVLNETVRKNIEQFVKNHLALGMLDELKDAVLSGNVGVDGMDVGLELPHFFDEHGLAL